MKSSKIHFIGIGGIGTSALAQIDHDKGWQVSGSDMKESEITLRLATKGIQIVIGHGEENIKNPDIVVYSPAIPDSNPELLKAKELKIKCQSYPEALGELTKDYFTIAIAGTHGKSTTTAMTALMMESANLDPTVIIGTKIKEFDNQNYRLGKSKYLIMEACEYKGSFQNIQPDILVITNIEADHLDYFKTEENYKNNFARLINKLDQNATLIINKIDKNSIEISKTAPCKVVEYKKAAELKLKVAGDFNLQNAGAVQKLGEILKIDHETIKKSLENFEGTWRRMEYKKKIGETQFIDDYGHHPTEVKATLKAIREKYPTAKILCIFQPHQYSRTKFFLKDFGTAFTDADQVIIPDIYAVRDSEDDLRSVSTDDLVHEINHHGAKAQNGNGLKATAEKIKEDLKNYDIIVTMGAGNIEDIYKML